jgi:hypothetical protein
MTNEFIDFNILAKKIHEQELKRSADNFECPYQHYVALVAKALGEAITKPDQTLIEQTPDYDQFNDDMSKGYDIAYNLHFVGTPANVMAEAAIRILDLFAMRGIKICDLDNGILNMAPKCFATDGHSLMTVYVYDLIATLTYHSSDDCSMLDILKLWEADPNDKELENIIEKKFGEVEYPEDIEIRTSYGFENYMLYKTLIVVLNCISSWFRAQGGKSLVWHINARMYYLSHFD